MAQLLPRRGRSGYKYDFAYREPPYCHRLHGNEMGHRHRYLCIM
jgi:hypothetical protein